MEIKNCDFIMSIPGKLHKITVENFRSFVIECGSAMTGICRYCVVIKGKLVFLKHSGSLNN